MPAALRYRRAATKTPWGRRPCSRGRCRRASPRVAGRPAEASVPAAHRVGRVGSSPGGSRRAAVPACGHDRAPGALGSAPCPGARRRSAGPCLAGWSAAAAAGFPATPPRRADPALSSAGSPSASTAVRVLRAPARRVRSPAWWQSSGPPYRRAVTAPHDRTGVSVPYGEFVPSPRGSRVRRTGVRHDRALGRPGRPGRPGRRTAGARWPAVGPLPRRVADGRRGGP